MQLIDWGVVDYAAALDRQRALVDQRIAGQIDDTLVFTEHPPVYTLGARPGSAEHLVWDDAARAAAGIALHASNRGGDITYHGPGQVVGYPIISLQTSRDLHRYLRLLEEVLLRTVARLGVAAVRRAGKTGIWIEDRKLAAIGVAVRQWVTYHGFALNVDPELAHFDGIVPCGITDGSVTSLRRECGACPTNGEVKALLALEFRAIMTNL
jgi:lipoyl(octanoyl) transferase